MEREEIAARARAVERQNALVSAGNRAFAALISFAVRTRHWLP
jgi:hypothetical protein